MMIFCAVFSAGFLDKSKTLLYGTKNPQQNSPGKPSGYEWVGPSRILDILGFYT